MCTLRILTLVYCNVVRGFFKRSMETGSTPCVLGCVPKAIPQYLWFGVLQYVSCCRECHRYRIAWPVIMFTAYAKVTSTWLPRDKVSQQNIEHFNKITNVIHNRTSFTGCCGSLLCSSVLQKSFVVLCSGVVLLFCYSVSTFSTWLCAQVWKLTGLL